MKMLYFVGLIVVVTFAGAHGQECDMNAAMACMTHANDITSVFSTGQAPTAEAIKSMCTAYNSMMTCINNLPESCSSTFASVNQMSAQAGQYCNSGTQDGCDMQGIMACSAQISMLGGTSVDNPMTSIVQVASQCQVYEDAMSCVMPKLEKCKDNEAAVNMSTELNKMKPLVDFVCKEKKQELMKVGECASKPEAMQALQKCPMSKSKDTTQFCRDLDATAMCLKKELVNTCTAEDVNTLEELMKVVGPTFVLNNMDACKNEAGGSASVVSSIWTSLMVILAAITL